jgi:autotransporter adhesin
VNGSQLYALASQIGPNSQAMNQINNNLNVLGQSTMAGLSTAYGQINNNQKEARQGIAMAAALAQAPMPSSPGKTSWKFNNAVYKNAAATSISVAHRLPTRVPIAVTAGIAIGLRNSAIVSGGLQGEF